MPKPETKLWTDTTPSKLRGTEILKAEDLISAGMPSSPDQHPEYIAGNAINLADDKVVSKLFTYAEVVAAQANTLRENSDRELKNILAFYEELEAAIKKGEIKIAYPVDPHLVEKNFNTNQKLVIDRLESIAENNKKKSQELSEIADSSKELADYIKVGKPKEMQTVDYFNALVTKAHNLYTKVRVFSPAFIQNEDTKNHQNRKEAIMTLRQNSTASVFIKYTPQSQELYEKLLEKYNIGPENNINPHGKIGVSSETEKAEQKELAAFPESYKDFEATITKLSAHFDNARKQILGKQYEINFSSM